MEETRILAIGFLNGQNCQKNNSITNKSTHGEINDSTSTKHEFCEVHKMFYNLSERMCTVCTLFALQRIFDGFNHLKNDFLCKTDKKVCSTARTKILKIHFVPRSVLSESNRVH